MKNNKSLTIILIFLGIVGVVMCYVASNREKYEEKKNMKISLERSIMASNVDELYDTIENEKNATTVIMNLTETLKYIYMIIEDTPKADSINEYYTINEKAINDIFGLKTVEEFNKFYEKLKNLKHFNRYEIVKDSIKNTGDNYYFDVKLSGKGECEFPILVVVKDAENNEGEIMWMGEKK